MMMMMMVLISRQNRLTAQDPSSSLMKKKKKGSRLLIASSSSSSFIGFVITLLLVILSSSPLTRVSSFSVSTTTTSNSRPSLLVGNTKPENPTSAELLKLLLQQEQTTSNGTTPNNDSTTKSKIDSLVQSLIQSKSSFDPITCINGDFFATVYTLGAKTPLWEKLAMASNTNLKGQKYTITSNKEEDENNNNKVVNYSEIFGNAINLKAFGTFTDRGPVGSTVDSSPTSSLPDDKDKSSSSSSSPFTSIQNAFQSIIPSSSSKKSTKNNSINKLNPCPYDYDVTVTGASIDIFGLSIEIPISGTGCARVLYADPCLRIFISPNDTNVETGGGDWESAGLISIQVRVDLINPNWNVIL